MFSRIPLPTGHGWGILLPVVLLCTASVLTLYAIGDADDAGFLASEAGKQLRFILLAGLGMLALLMVGYQRIGRWSFLLFLLSILLLTWVVADRWVNLPLVYAVRNSRRWIFLPGFQVQPSEIMKIVYVLALAWYLRYRRNYRSLPGLIAPFAITLIPMALILVQPDLGTVLLFPPVLFAMLFAAGAKMRHLVVIVLLGLMCAPVFWFKVKSYQRLRITGVMLQSPAVRAHFENRPDHWDALRSPDTDHNEWRRELSEWEARAGFQLVHSKVAIGSGGPWGQGWARGVFVDHSLLPENDNDFVFAMVAHQWGLIGSIVLIFCYALIVLMGFDVAVLTADPFGRLLAVGLSSLLAIQSLTNLGMTVGLGPITGVTLPFVSAGGSSMLTSFICVGLLISVAQRRPILMSRKPFQFDEADRSDLNVPEW